MGERDPRAARLAILHDRQERGAALPTDGPEALKIAQELLAEVEEMGGWKKLTQANARVLERVATLITRADGLFARFDSVIGRLEGYLARFLAAEEKWAKLAAAFTRPRILLPAVVLILLMIGALTGAFQVEPIRVDLPGLQSSPSSSTPETADVHP